MTTMTKITITSQTCAQGSYGLRRINRGNGTDISAIITAWHVMTPTARLDSYLSRGDARRAAAILERSADTEQLAALRRGHRNYEADRLAASIIGEA